MLNYLTIANFALIENASVEFADGFSVFTGESGAGKSIMMASIELLAGGRAEKNIIRSGCKNCTICGEFTVPETLAEEISQILENAGIEFSRDEKILNIRRSISASATRNFINDTPVGAKLLADVGSRLIDIHGANEQISLTVPARQMELLDSFGNLAGLKAECAKNFYALKALEDECAAFEADLPDAAEADRCSLIAEEIDHIDPAPDEDRILADKQRLGANARQVLENIAQLTAMLTESENSVADQLGSVYHLLSDLEKLAPSLAPEAAGECADLQNTVSELSGKLAALTDSVDLDPESLCAIEARLGEIHTLKRRYGPTLEQVFDTREKVRECLQKFTNAKNKRAEFAARKKELTASLADRAEKLSAARKKSVQKFLTLALEKLAAIGFNGAQMDASFTEVPPGANGKDRLELLFNANRGEELRPLRKVASSGELSRVMLALKTVLADADAVPTVIFDEIDMNIGGETANKVAEELHNLGKQRQILCISHLAQVASKADRHYRVVKHSVNDRTFSEVQLLADPVPELARMLGGGASALQHAASLLDKKA
ncbi:MAG: DNA repair protein RecN [Lentisphaerae bacterium]|nr:DNA repair protein RecN [Lentisphaerota bacterium]